MDRQPKDYKWFAVETATGYDRKVCDNIITVANNRDMRDQILAACLPYEIKVKKKAKKKRTAAKQTQNVFIFKEDEYTKDEYVLQPDEPEKEDEEEYEIEEVRNLYHGPITYEFTCDSRKAYDLKWMNSLDFLSYSYYPPACASNVEGPLNPMSNPGAKDNPSKTVEEMMDYLESRKARIQSISQRFNNLPIAFTEYGVRSAHGCIMQPYNFLWETYYDGEEQANFMEASFRTFWGLPEWMGLFWWKWDETQNRPHYHTDPRGDMGFTIQGKPAEAVMQKWIKKSRSEKR